MASGAKQNPARGLIEVAIFVLGLVEVVALVALLLGGELGYFWSAGMQGGLFALSLILTSAAAVPVAPRRNFSPAAAPRHPAGCRLCGASGAPTYSTEYGWYDTTNYKWAGGERWETKFESWGESEVHLCDACASAELDARRERAWGLALRTLIIAAPLLALALATRNGLPWLEGAARTDYFITASVVAFLAAVALLYPLVVFLARMENQKRERTPEGRLRSVRTLAKPLSWEIARLELEDKYETVSTEETGSGAAVTRRAGFAPRSPEVDKWERTPRPAGFGPNVRIRKRPQQSN